MKLSFIIVAYNAGNSLQNSLGSLLEQDYPHENIEVILVDGLSSDNTKRTMLDFQQNVKSFDKIIVKDNPGKYLACGWNVALSEASGDIILRVDAHTKFPKDFISKNIECIETGEDICGGKVISILENDSPFDRVMLKAENSMFGGGFSFFRRGQECRYTSTLAFAAYRKHVFDAVGRYNENLVRTEDNEMHYRMAKKGYKFLFNPEIISYRFCRNNLESLMRQKFLNGYWVGLTMGIAPRAFSPFYLIPFIFVITIIAALILCFITPWPLIILLFAYVIVLLLSLVSAIKNTKFYRAILLLPLIIAELHICYGLGTFKGLIYLPFWKRKIKDIER